MHAMMMYNNGFQPKKILSVLFPHVETNPFLSGKIIWMNSERISLIFSESAALKLIRDIVDKPPKRIKLINYNTFQDAVELFRLVVCAHTYFH